MRDILVKSPTGEILQLQKSQFVKTERSSKTISTSAGFDNASAMNASAQMFVF